MALLYEIEHSSSKEDHYNLYYLIIRGPKALFNMVDICLNPDSDIVGGETFEASENAK